MHFMVLDQDGFLKLKSREDMVFGEGEVTHEDIMNVIMKLQGKIQELEITLDGALDRIKALEPKPKTDRFGKRPGPYDLSGQKRMRERK